MVYFMVVFGLCTVRGESQGDAGRGGTTQWCVVFVAEEKVVLAVLGNTNVDLPFVDFSMNVACFFLLHHYELLVDLHLFFSLRNSAFRRSTENPCVCAI
jgi:hypothetical protein